MRALNLSAPAGLASTFILYGLLTDAVASLWKPFALTYLDRLGGGATAIFLYNYLPALASALALIPSLLIIRHMGGIGRAGLRFLIAGRALLLLMAALPFFPESMRPWAFVAAASLMAMPDSSALSAIQAYAGRIFNPDDRIAVMARRLAWGQPVALIVTTAMGALLKFSPLGDGPAARLALYQITFVLSSVLGIAEVLVFRRLRSIGGTQTFNSKVSASLRRMVGDRRFMAFFFCSAAFHFGWMMGWPLFSVWQVEYLHADEGWLAAFSVTGTATMFFSYGLWRRIVARRGLGVTLGLATLGQALNPVLSAFADTLPLQIVIQVFMGFFTAGVSAAFISGLLHYSPETEDKLSFSAVYNVALYSIQVISQVLGQMLYQAMGIRGALFLDGAVRLAGAASFIIFFSRERLIPGGVGIQAGEVQDAI